MRVNCALKNKILNKRCAILGLGVSNIPLTRLLLSFGSASSITVYDKKSPNELGNEALELEKQGVLFVWGEKCFDRIEADIIFRSPGIRPDRASIPEAVAKGAILTSEIEQLLELSPSPVYAITGSDGKTTTTTLCGKFLEEAAEGKVFVGGNIGTPLLDRADGMTERDACVLELSSFQLMSMKNCPSPTYAAITNLSPNHLDWHVDLEEYLSAKQNIVGENTKRLVVNADSPHTAAFGRKVASEGRCEVVFFSSSETSFERICGRSLGNLKAIFMRNSDIILSDGKNERFLLNGEHIKLPGRHNKENYMAAMALCYDKVSADIFDKVAREFGGVEHRLEFVRRFEGADYYNSSIDSSPSRTVAALSALDGRDIVAICGGYDKNLSYAPLAEALCQKARVAVLTGATAEKIERAIEEYKKENPDQSLTVIRAQSFEDAVATARSRARENTAVILTPAGASFDRFKNFAERGKYFKELVNGFN